MDHISIEDLSAYLDGELEHSERDRVLAHVNACSECGSDLDSLRGASSAVSMLGAEADIPPEDLAALRSSIPAYANRWWSRRGVLAGAAAAGLAAVVGIALVTFGPRQTGDQLASQEAALMTFASDEQVREALEDDPAIRDAAGKWTVADTGRLASSAEAGSSDSTSEDDRGPVSGQTLDCSRQVVSSQPYPMRPVMTRPAVFRGVDSWLLVYAYTPERDPEARLDRFQIWIVRQTDCSTLHYSFFRPKQD